MRKFFIPFLLSLFLGITSIPSAQAARVWSHYLPGNSLFGGDILVRNQCEILDSTPFVLEGATIDSYETRIAVTDPTADRTITLPNDSGTVMLGDTPVKSLTKVFDNLDPSSVDAQSCLDVEVTLTGAKAGDAVVIGPPADFTANLSVCGYVSAPDKVQIRLCNPTSAAIDPPAASYRVTVLDY